MGNPVGGGGQKAQGGCTAPPFRAATPPRCVTHSASMSASSLIDAALGVPSRQSSAVNIGGTSAIAARVAEQEVHVGPIWGSFEVRARPCDARTSVFISLPSPACSCAQRNTGTWTPYSVAENRLIESAFHSGVATVEVPTCFNAVVHFNRAGGYHHQMTPAAGTKPPGFRSVLRGTAGESATLCASAGLAPPTSGSPLAFYTLAALLACLLTQGLVGRDRAPQIGGRRRACGGWRRLPQSRTRRR